MTVIARPRLNSASDDRQVRAPWADRFAVLLCHDARNLGDVPEIVRNPGREQLTQADLSEFGMLTREIELRIAQPPGRDRGIERSDRRG